ALEASEVESKAQLSRLGMSNEAFKRDSVTANTKIQALKASEVESKAQFSCLEISNEALKRDSVANFNRTFDDLAAAYNAEIEAGLPETCPLQRETVLGQADITGMKLAEGTKIIVEQVATQFKSMNDQLRYQKHQLSELKSTKEQLARQGC
ncbi:hypothetical protein V498_09952, partial [Pseudogymnoascus sp. VKM F-4517 (FW-2822)]